jgi:hypothetical protein
MVELRTRKRWMRRYGGNHQEKLGLNRLWCASQFTIPDTAGRSPVPGCNYTETSVSQPNQASGTRDISYPLVVTSCSSSSLISLFLVHNSTIIAEYQVMSSRSMSPYHDRELTPSSTAYLECSIHRLQYSPKIVCLPFMIMIPS